MTILSTRRGETTPGPATDASQDFIGKPDWRDVTLAELHQQPWVSICAVELVDTRGTIQSRGTGWVAGPRTVITAAHVLLPARGNPAATATVTFPALNISFSTTLLSPHPQFLGDSQAVDLFDIAALQFAAEVGAPLSAAMFSGGQMAVEVAGFPSGSTGLFKTHRGDAVRSTSIPALLLHSADTQPGHSGAPVVTVTAAGEMQVIALHVHEDNANPDEHIFGARNVALLLRDELLTFIDESVHA